MIRCGTTKHWVGVLLALFASAPTARGDDWKFDVKLERIDRRPIC